MTRLWLLFAVFVLGGCATTPDEVERVRMENELLREQIRIIKHNCGYYRDLEILPPEQEMPEP